MVVTSPPYAKQRDYDRPIACWDTMMMGALNGHAFADDVQLLINLGPTHKDGQWAEYWQNWIDAMKVAGWRQFTVMVWDKVSALPGINHGRARPSHEFIFHLNKKPLLMNKTEPCKYYNKDIVRAHGLKRKDGSRSPHMSHAGRPIQSHRILNSVIRMPAEKANRTGHPAVYPIALPAKLISAWKKPGCIVYDPFVGSGTTILAAEKENVVGLGCEISPAYVTIALARWNKTYPHMPANKVAQ